MGRTRTNAVCHSAWMSLTHRIRRNAAQTKLAPTGFAFGFMAVASATPDQQFARVESPNPAKTRHAPCLASFVPQRTDQCPV